MNSEICKLIYLIHEKNLLNRRRHRFYYVWHGRYSRRRGKVVRPTHISEEEAKIGYRKAQEEMKRMTPAIRALRVELGVQIGWGSSGQVKYIQYGPRVITAKYFPLYHQQAIELAKVDSILLGE